MTEKHIPPPWDNGIPGTVYLIHFESKYHHAQHYVGWASDLQQRLELHAMGNGSKLMAAVSAAGIPWTLARTWEGATRNFERKVHQRKKTRELCPLCRANGGSDR